MTRQREHKPYPVHIRIATRNSALALWQAEEVSRQLRQVHHALSTELVRMTTTGDHLLQKSLATQGGKGLFVKELELALLENRADIAVHSMKDVPIELPSELHLPVMLERENPHDALVSTRYRTLDALPKYATVGTSSLRRACQLKASSPDLEIKLLRGNVGTRLARLDRGEYDAIILAVAGLKRLGLAERIQACLSADELLPAIGQGAIGIECRHDDPAIESMIQPLNHKDTQACILAERAVSRALEGGCQLPIAGFAELDQEQLTLRALVGDPDGGRICRSQDTGSKKNPVKLGRRVAEALRTQGADEILAALP